MAFQIDQVYSENPYADIVVYYAKVLGIDTVLKMKDVADQNETEESLKNADLYIACMEKTVVWDLFDEFPEEVLIKSGLTGQALVNALLNPASIPASKKDAVLENMRLYVIDNYEEKNNYYRMLQGLPPMGYENVYITDTSKVDDSIGLDISIPVHKQSPDMINILDRLGILDDMYEEDPENRGYLRYLKKKISPYSARKASAFYPLYVPTIDSTELSDEYKDRLEVNRRYALGALYSQAYKFESDYYDNFIAVFIILNTMIDMITRIQEFIARKEVFDIRTVRYIFESYGVTFFPEIPLKYQIRMVKNLHFLLKYKSTAKCMVDICSLFGFDNIEIFKYYLLRNRKKTGPDQYSFTGDDTKDFELKFVKIPIDEEMDDYIRDPSYQMKYDEITAGDPTWDGGLDHDYVKRMHQGLEFNYTRTKYLSVDAVYDLAKIAIQQSYFFNMLYDDVEVEDLIKVDIPYLADAPVEISDLFTFLTALTFRYNKVSDSILDTSSKVLYVYGFNFKADLAELGELFRIFNAARVRTEDPEDKKMSFSAILKAKDALDSFMLPTDQIPSFNQLMMIFKNNLDIREVLVYGMKHADNKRMYDTYKKLYDSLMIMELTTKHFADPETGELWRDESGDATYTEYLHHVNPTLYYKLIEIDMMDEQESRIQYIANLIDSIVFALEQYIDTDEFEGIFHGLPAVSADAVKEYIKMVIDFYKSYKVHFLGVNTLYTFDDDFEGWVRIIDDALLKRMFWKDDVVPVIDQIAAQLNRITQVDPVTIRERIHMDIKTWRYLDAVDRLIISDDHTHIVRLPRDEKYEILDMKESLIRIAPNDKIPLLDARKSITVRLHVDDYVAVKDFCYFSEYPADGNVYYSSAEDQASVVSDGGLTSINTSVTILRFDNLSCEKGATITEAINTEKDTLDGSTIIKCTLNRLEIDSSIADIEVNISGKIEYNSSTGIYTIVITNASDMIPWMGSAEVYVFTTTAYVE